MNILRTNFWKNTKGIAAMEFALLAPILLTIMMSVLEVSHYVYASQKNEFSVNNIEWILNKQNQLSSEQIQQITTMVTHVHVPIPMPDTNYHVIITSMQRDKPGIDAYEKPYIYWQEAYGNPALSTSSFKYVKGGDQKTNELTAQNLQTLRGYTFETGDQVIHVDVTTRYTPLIINNFVPETSRLMRYASFSRPRKGAFQFRPDELQQ